MPAGLDLGGVHLDGFVVHPARAQGKLFFEIFVELVAPSIGTY